jgi:hypothetical protein
LFISIIISMMQQQALQQQGEKQCVQTQDFSTAYNTNVEVPPYQGIMFEVAAATNIRLTTLELDVRLDQAAAAGLNGLMVEVYVTNGGYLDIMDDPSMWIQVANTNLQLLGGTTGVIPKNEFQPINIDGGQRRSIYVSLSGGDYLDHTAYALAKTGELAAENKDLKVYVGTGFLGPSFVTAADKVLDPQFAGTIQYETTLACSALVHETVVSLAYVAELEDASDGMARLSFLLAEAMALVMDDLLATDPDLARFVAEFQLKRTNLQTSRNSDFSGTSSSVSHHVTVPSFCLIINQCFPQLVFVRKSGKSVQRCIRKSTFN